jgi:hypothetical protein
MQQFAVNTDFLPLGIDSCAELGDHLPIDLDAAFLNQLLALAPAGDASRGKHFLEAIRGIRRLRIILLRGTRTRRGPTKLSRLASGLLSVRLAMAAGSWWHGAEAR